MLDWLIGILAGLAAGLIVNFLADLLPFYQLGDEEDDTDIDDADSSAETDVESPQEFSWSVARLYSPRYLIVTALLVLLAIYVWQRQPTPLSALSYFIYLALFMLIAVIDIEHKLVLTVVMIPAFVYALIEIFLSGRLLIQDAFVGYAVAQIIQMGFYLLGAIYLAVINARRGEAIHEVAFGFGDVTLATFCGLVLGYPDVVLMLMLMVLIGGMMALVFLIIRLIITRQYQAHLAIPYGPAIVIAAAAMLLWGQQVAYYLLGGR
jgi:prepilin signal peptidase PulO-like enzyme (type II secretory pathway)